MKKELKRVQHVISIDFPKRQMNTLYVRHDEKEIVSGFPSAIKLHSEEIFHFGTVEKKHSHLIIVILSNLLGADAFADEM